MENPMNNWMITGATPMTWESTRISVPIIHLQRFLDVGLAMLPTHKPLIMLKLVLPLIFGHTNLNHVVLELTLIVS